MTPATPVVSVRSLCVDYASGRGAGLRRAVDGLDLDIHPGQALGLVGESGSGKSTVALALTRYLPPRARVQADRLQVAGTDVLALDAAGLRAYRRRRIGVVYQEPARALNPTATVGAQVAEVHRLRGLDRGQAREEVLRAFDDVGLPDPPALASRYPHELSGGQQQRVVIAMALAARPRLLVLDEPTTGLDSQVQASVLALIDRLRGEHGFASLLVSHDLPLVAAHCDDVAVLRAGRLVEVASARALTGAATGVVGTTHPYTRELVAAVPAVDGPSRPWVDTGAPALLRARGLAKAYGDHRALAGVDLHLHRGETLGVVGESGSGKTTLGRVLAGLVGHGGAVELDAPSAPPPVQVVFQSPDASLNPRRTVRQVLGRSIQLLGGDGTPEELVALTGLPTRVLDALPHQLSGGQKQRVAIARAFAGRSPVVVCDEPTSALDVSVQATVLDLLVALQERTGVAYVFISHDLAVVRSIAHRVAVMHRGRVVETGSVQEVLDAARHPLTRQLVEAARGGPRAHPGLDVVTRSAGR